jgi:hypothetical protein
MEHIIITELKITNICVLNFGKFSKFKKSVSAFTDFANCMTYGSALSMEALNSPEKLVILYRTTWRHILFIVTVVMTYILYHILFQGRVKILFECLLSYENISSKGLHCRGNTGTCTKP